MLIVFVVITDDLDTSSITGCDVTAQYIEMPAEVCVGHQVHTWLDHRAAISLRTQTGLDCMQNLIIGQGECGHIVSTQVTKRNLCQLIAPGLIYFAALVCYTGAN